ncbi:hypothetical protein B0H16DRAFT_1665104 [Mycena metata]|uniref:Uncharacterized protein n=1 Tax=Mycena metata TaxID=1033252 RepID=A0AAD7MUB4_9AGAR|nr:hypothetical protein B0H16DRAFT_1665104 [Mycena metata]
MPAAAVFPSVVITVRVLEVFRRLQLRCPRVGVQAFVRTLCDLHGVAPRGYLVTQFTVAFDIYLAILAAVNKWNNSLKRFWRREKAVDADGNIAPGASRERLDTRVPAGDYYLSREEVDKWSKEGLEDLMRDFVPGSEEEGSAGDEGAGCSERWQNMKEDATARAYGMYDETGIFPALCRHGFVLVIVDMVKSGELAKYGFAITAHLIGVLGKLGLGYDIGCKFAEMVRMHPALAKLAADNDFKALVGAFHGHAHNRRCQLCNLTTYVHGVGLEDLEGCEKFFSKSNALAATTQYATVFHRQQAITSYLKHADTADAYQGLCKLYLTSFIKGTAVLLRETMHSMGIESRSVFETWLEKEKIFLATLSKEPPQETLEMEYYQKLVNLQDLEERVGIITNVGLPIVIQRTAAGDARNGVLPETGKPAGSRVSLPYVFQLQLMRYRERVGIITNVGLPILPINTDTTYAAAASQTRRIETQRRHAIEARDKTLAVVADLELRLNIARRWEDDGDDWIRVAMMVKNRRYQHAIDALEGLVVARCLSCYKLRKHIAKALQARSKGLSWEQIVDYAFLADFDLLRDGREDIRGEPWAQPAGRLAMDQHFKLLRADEEIARLNLEIPRLVTHMADEDRFLIYHERRLTREGNPALAHQVAAHRMERGRFNALHMERLVKLSKEPGCTACITPGVSVNKERRVPEEQDIEMPDVTAVVPPPEGAEGDIDEDVDLDTELLIDSFERILVMSDDS